MKNLKWYMAQHESWLQGRDKLPYEVYKMVASSLGNSTEPMLAELSVELGMLSVYFGRLGQLDLYRGKSCASENLSKSFFYLYWRIRIAAEDRFKYGAKGRLGDFTSWVSETACLLMVFVSAGEDQLAAKLAKILERTFVDEFFVENDFMQRRAFEPFALWLYKKIALRSNNIIQGCSGKVYRSVVEGWSDNSQWDFQIREMMAYHFSSIKKTEAGWASAFLYEPFGAFVYEVLNVCKARGQEPKLSAGEGEFYNFTARGVDAVSLSPDETCLEVEEYFSSMISCDDL